MAKGSAVKRPRKDSAKSLEKGAIRNMPAAKLAMTNDPLRAWAIKAWEKGAIRNMPAAKLARQLKAERRESKRAWGRARRSLLASQAASQRKLNQRLADLERESRDRREVQDREFEERRWELLMGKK